MIKAGDEKMNYEKIQFEREIIDVVLTFNLKMTFLDQIS